MRHNAGMACGRVLAAVCASRAGQQSRPVQRAVQRLAGVLGARDSRHRPLHPVTRLSATRPRPRQPGRPWWRRSGDLRESALVRTAPADAVGLHAPPAAPLRRPGQSSLRHTHTDISTKASFTSLELEFANWDSSVNRLKSHVQN